MTERLNNNEPKNETKNETGLIKEKIVSDQRTIQALSYLTTLARLPENRDLDELFDGEVQLGEEELLAVYSLIEVVNGSNTIGVLKTPKTMKMDVAWGQNYSWNIGYNNVMQNGEKKSQVSFLEGSGTLPFTKTKLKLNYEPNGQLKNLYFERPTNLNQTGALGINQTINIKRERGLATEISIMRKMELDNKLSINYNYLGKPELIEQTKVGLLSDKMAFEYDENGNLKSIIYIPSLSLKHLKGLTNIVGKKVGGPLQTIKIAGEYISFSALKKLNGVDVVEVKSENGIIQSTKSDLGASQRIYRKGFSRNTHNSNGELQKVHLEKDNILVDDQKKLQIQY